MADEMTALQQAVQCLAEAGLRIAVAETSAGGRLSAALTALPGSSAWFDCGTVDYSYPARLRVPGVQEADLQREGAVSAWAVRVLCEAMLERSDAGLVMAESFVVGPAGGNAEKPVGSGFLAWQLRGSAPLVRACQFAGDRDAVFRQIVDEALAGIPKIVESLQGTDASS